MSFPTSIPDINGIAVQSGLRLRLPTSEDTELSLCPCGHTVAMEPPFANYGLDDVPAFIGTKISVYPTHRLHSSGVFLVTAHDFICTDDGDIWAALYDSFLPIPSPRLSPLVNPSNLPGVIIAKKERIVVNRGCERIKLMVINKGDHPIQVGSHYHFVETPAFDRVKVQCASDLISLQAQLYASTLPAIPNQSRYERELEKSGIGTVDRASEALHMCLNPTRL